MSIIRNAAPRIVIAVLTLAVSGPALAQESMPYPLESVVAYEVDSGPRDNPGPDFAVVFEHTVVFPADIASMRLYFSEIVLAPGSTLRITSPRDGEVQAHDRYSARDWGNSTGYFNGNTLIIELVAAPKSQGNRMFLSNIGVEIGLAAGCANTPCGACSPDGRVVSNEDWSARYKPAGCTASIYDINGCFVTAGHCFTISSPTCTAVSGTCTVLTFRNPLSLNDCTPQQPPIDDQFPVLADVSNGSACAPDYRVGRIGRNMSGQSHYQRYGVFKPIATVPPVASDTMDIYGFGASSIPVVNSVQQQTTETVTAVGSISFNYAGGTTTGGTSGSGVIINGAIAGINTCCGGACSGIASRVDQPAFIAAREAMCPHTVHAPWDIPFCLNDTQVIVPITVCNTTSSPDSYTLTFVGLPPGPMCAVQGPVTFVVQGGPLIGPINPGQCLTANVIITRPIGLTAALLTSCYEVTATSVNTSVAVTDRGSVQDRRDMCTGFVLGGGPLTLYVDRVQPLDFTVRNDTGVPLTFPYRVEAFGPDMEPSGAISLDGGFEGVPADGVASIPAGATEVLSVNVRDRWWQPAELTDLVVSTDMNGDGVYEPLTSIALRSEIACPADFNGDGRLNVFDFLAFQTAFGNADPSADLDGNGVLNVFDFLAFQSAFGNGC